MKILKIDYHSPQAPEQFVRSLQQTGFAVLYDHDIDASLFEQVKKEWSVFFASDNKLNYLYDKQAARQDGYFPTESAKGQTVDDVKEFYHLYRNARVPDGISSATWQLREQLLAIGLNLLQWLDTYTPAAIKAKFSRRLPEMVDRDGLTLFRILHYPPQQQAPVPGAVRAAAHTDIDLLTVLPASGEAGLQAMDKAGDWHQVPCDSNMIIINAGDFLQMCSHHYYQSTLHRVINPSAQRSHVARYAFPLFLHSYDDVILDTTTGFTAGEYLDERLTELGLK